MTLPEWWRYYHTECKFSTIPLKRRSKSPLLKWQPYQDRRPTSEEINYWVRKYGHDNNVAVVCGAVSGIIVLDIDGQPAWDFLSENGYDLPPTPRAQSSPGKAHIYFKHPWPDKGVRTKVNSKLKLDIKGDGSYVVAPPSIHPKTDLPYEWVEGCSPKDLEIAVCPPWLIAYLKEHYSEHSSGTSTGLTEASTETRPTDGSPPKEMELESKPGVATIVFDCPQGDEIKEDVDDFTSILRGVAEGGRNAACARLAGVWIVQGMSTANVWEMLTAWNLKNNPPLPEREIRTVLNSIATRDARKKLKETDFDAPANTKNIDDIRSPAERREDILEGISSRLKVKIIKIEKYLGEQPKYVFHVAGRNGRGAIEVWLTADELLNQRVFRAKMLGATNYVVPPIKADKKKAGPTWEDYTQRMVDIAIDIEVGSESTIAGEILSSLRAYIRQHKPQNYDLDAEITEQSFPFIYGGKTWINFSDFRRWMLLFRVAIKVTHQELSQRLKHCGFISQKFLLPGRDKAEKYWHVPDDLLELEKNLTEKEDGVK